MGEESRGYRGFERPRVVEAAAERHWVMSIGELAEVGMSRDQVDRAARDGFLFRVHRGVFAVGRPQLGFEARCRAAVLACGPAAAVSHASAARFWGIWRAEGAIHVSVPRGRHGHPGLRVHRPVSLLPNEIVDRNGIAATTVARTLLDVAATVPEETVARMLHEADVQRVGDLRAVHAVLEAHPAHRGRAKLGRALALEVAPTRSGLERAFVALCREAGLPRPLVNRHLWSTDRLEEVDFHWPAARFVVEVDGSRYHSTRYRRRVDAAKTRRLEEAGWTVRRFGELDVELKPAAVVSETRRGLAKAHISRLGAPVSPASG
jgi:hypothetical protein